MESKTLANIPSEFIADYIWRTVRLNLRTLRLQHSYSLLDIKNFLNHKSLTTISRFERGEGRLGMEDIYILCSLYNKTLSEIFPTAEEVSQKFELKFEKVNPVQNVYLKHWDIGETALKKTIISHFRKKTK